VIGLSPSVPKALAEHNEPPKPKTQDEDLLRIRRVGAWGTSAPSPQDQVETLRRA
jgi:hypothetical protein